MCKQLLINTKLTYNYKIYVQIKKLHKVKKNEIFHF